MKITGQRTDQAILSEVGERLAGYRLQKNVSQAQLARESGVSKRTIERMEAGESVQMTSFLRVLRTLDLVERLDAVLPEPEASPMEQLRRRGRRRQRATPERRRPSKPRDWSWGDDS